MKSRRRAWRFVLLTAVLALITAACTTTESTTTTEAPPDPTTTQGGDDPAPTTTERMADYGDPVTLNLGHPFPEQHPIHQNALLPYAQAVNEATGGVVTIEFHAGGSLAAAPATFENTVAGGQDLGWALQGYHAGTFPITEIVEQPFQFASAVQATKTMWDLYDEFPAFQDEYSSVQLLGLWVHDVGDLWTKDKEVKVLEDVAGLTLRFPTRVIGQVITAMGGTPVGMPAPQIFDSLNTGVIDGLMIAVSGLQSFNLYPELAYGTTCDCYVAAQYLAMNLDVFNSLTPDTQEVLVTLGRQYSLLAAEVYDAAYAAISQRAIDEGIIKYDLPADELARWHALGASVTEAWITEREGEGIPAQEMYDRMQAVKADYAP